MANTSCVPSGNTEEEDSVTGMSAPRRTSGGEVRGGDQRRVELLGSCGMGSGAGDGVDAALPVAVVSGVSIISAHSQAHSGQEAVRVEVHRADAGAAAEGAAPVSRAKERKVLEVAVTHSGPLMAGKYAKASSICASMCLRSFFTDFGDGGSSGSRSRVRRPAPRGRDSACEGSSS